MSIGILNLSIKLDNVHSLKEKRHIIKPLVNQLRKKFNISIAETNDQDSWDRIYITCVMVSNEESFLDKSLKARIKYIEHNYYQHYTVEENIEILI